MSRLEISLNFDIILCLDFCILFCLDFSIHLSLDFKILLCLDFSILLCLDFKILLCWDFNILFCLDLLSLFLSTVWSVNDGFPVTSGNLPKLCQKPAGRLPETFVNWFLAGFWQVSGRFPAGFQQVSDK